MPRAQCRFTNRLLGQLLLVRHQPNTMRDLYFLCARGGGPGSSAVPTLIKIKVSDTETMYLAASSRNLAERLRDIYPRLEFSIIAASDLTPENHFDFGANRVAVIESGDDLARYASDPSTFPYEAHAIRYGEQADV